MTGCKAVNEPCVLDCEFPASAVTSDIQRQRTAVACISGCSRCLCAAVCENAAADCQAPRVFENSAAPATVCVSNRTASHIDVGMIELAIKQGPAFTTNVQDTAIRLALSGIPATLEDQVFCCKCREILNIRYRDH